LHRTETVHAIAREPGRMPGSRAPLLYGPDLTLTTSNDLFT
jgi:hypothetical protein